MLLEDSIHHYLHLVEALLIKELVILLLGMHEGLSREEIGALVATSDLYSTLSVSTNAATLDDVRVKLLNVNDILWLWLLVKDLVLAR
jgi:hypothetical protein